MILNPNSSQSSIMTNSMILNQEKSVNDSNIKLNEEKKNTP
jgi:hypothetical protein